MSSQPKTILQIRHPRRGLVRVPLKNAKWTGDVYQLVHTGTFSFDETSEIGYSDIENGYELILTVIDASKNKRTFRFLVENISLHFEHNPETGEVLKNEVEITARSYPTILAKNSIEGIIKFSNGYGGIVRKIGRKYGFKVSKVKLINKNGVIYFRRMPILEAFRRMASLENWCFYFRDDEIIFGPCEPPQDSGVTLTEKQMISGTFTK